MCDRQNKIWKLCDESIDLHQLEPVIVKTQDQPGNLIQILQAAQRLFGCLPAQLLIYVAYRTNSKLKTVRGVAAFCSMLCDELPAKHLILLCTGTQCKSKHAAALEAALREILKTHEGEVTADGLFSYYTVACLACCNGAAALMVDETVYCNVTADQIAGILDATLQQNAGV